VEAMLRKALIRAAKPLKMPHRGFDTAGTIYAGTDLNIINRFLPYLSVIYELFPKLG
jgi:hypothetical protein